MNYQLLKTLCEIPSVAGRESRISSFIQENVKDFFDEIEIDPLGSIICKKFSKNKAKQNQSKAQQRKVKQSSAKQSKAKP